MVINGSPREKSTRRAEIIAAEIARVEDSANLRRVRVVMIGVVGKVMSAMCERGMRVQGVDLNPTIIGNDNGGARVLDASHTAKAIASSDIALVTGMTLPNSTLDRIVELCGASRVTLVMYAQTGSYFGTFYRDWGMRAVISESFPIYALPGTWGGLECTGREGKRALRRSVQDISAGGDGVLSRRNSEKPRDVLPRAAVRQRV